MTAWLITWEWHGQNKPVSDPIVAILNRDLPVDRVAEIAESVYVGSKFQLDRRLAYADTLGEFPFTARLPSGEIFCGTNPFLYGRLVDELKIEIDDHGNQKLVWTERYKASPELLKASK
jgi:hypothetical protein